MSRNQTCRHCGYCKITIEIGDDLSHGGMHEYEAREAVGICQLVPPQPVMVQYGFDGPIGHDLQWRQPEVYPDKTFCGRWAITPTHTEATE